VLFTPLVGVIRTAVAEVRRDDFPGATRPAGSIAGDEMRALVSPLAGI
jgi:hypothetical protein